MGPAGGKRAKAGSFLDRLLADVDGRFRPMIVDQPSVSGKGGGPNPENSAGVGGCILNI